MVAANSVVGACRRYQRSIVRLRPPRRRGVHPRTARIIPYFGRDVLNPSRLVRIGAHPPARSPDVAPSHSPLPEVRPHFMKCGRTSDAKSVRQAKPRITARGPVCPHFMKCGRGSQDGDSAAAHHPFHGLKRMTGARARIHGSSHRTRRNTAQQQTLASLSFSLCSYTRIFAHDRQRQAMMV